MNKRKFHSQKDQPRLNLNDLQELANQFVRCSFSEHYKKVNEISDKLKKTISDELLKMQEVVRSRNEASQDTESIILANNRKLHQFMESKAKWLSTRTQSLKKLKENNYQIQKTNSQIKQLEKRIEQSKNEPQKTKILQEKLKVAKLIQKSIIEQASCYDKYIKMASGQVDYFTEQIQKCQLLQNKYRLQKKQNELK